jgi:hypothetical protein
MLFWFCVDRLHAVGPDGQPTNSYDAISLQVTILSVILTALGIGLAIASIFGYQALREAMLARADEVVNERLQGHPAFAATFKGPPSGGSAPPQLPPAGGGVAEESENL